MGGKKIIQYKDHFLLKWIQFRDENVFQENPAEDSPFC